MMELKIKLLNGIKRLCKQEPFSICKLFVDFEGQKANDYIFQQLMENKSIMIAKFGTVELGVVGAFEIKHNYGIVSYFLDYMKGRVSLYSSKVLFPLCRQAGFFPNDVKLGERFYRQMLEDMQIIDILASYIYESNFRNTII